MAFGRIFYTDFKPLGQAVTYSIDIFKDTYVGTDSIIEIMNTEPMQLRNRGNKIDSIGAIIGTELEFVFWVQQSDGTIYDELLQASQKQYYIEVKRDAVLYFTGYLKPENHRKQLLRNQYKISLSISDELGNLKEFEYKNSTGDNYTDRTNFLTVIKRVLEKTALTLEFNIKLNTYESALMTASECALDKTTIDNNRFYKNEDGILKPMKCYDVLSMVLGEFNCSIRQYNNKWYIFNNVEVDSFLYVFDWSTLTQQGARAANNPILAIDSYDFKTVGAVSYRPPLSKVKITYENKYIPTNVIPNGDFSSGTTGWNNGTAPNNWGTFSVVSGELTLVAGGSLADPKEVITSSFGTLTQVNATDLLVLSVRAKVDSFTEAQGEAPFLSAVITGPNGSVTVNLGQLSEEWKLHEAGGSPLMQGTGNYTVKLVVDQEDLNVTALSMRIDDVEMFIDYGDGATTVDKLITITNVNAVDENILEWTTKIGDSIEPNDQGSIKVGTTLTGLWRTYNRTEDVNLLELLGVFQLNARQAFTEYMQLKIKDPADNIHSGLILTFNSKPYRIIRFNKTYKNISVDVDLLEINT